jgi:hypothetical protein
MLFIFFILATITVPGYLLGTWAAVVMLFVVPAAMWAAVANERGRATSHPGLDAR